MSDPIHECSEDYVDLIWHHSRIGQSVIDHGGRFLQANPHFCNLLGYSESELQKLQFQDITHPGDLDANVAEFRRVVKRERPSYEMVKRYVTKRGDVVWVNLWVGPMKTPAGSIVCFLTQVQPTEVGHESERREDPQPKVTIEQRLLEGLRSNWRTLLMGAVLVGGWLLTQRDAFMEQNRKLDQVLAAVEQLNKRVTTLEDK